MIFGINSFTTPLSPLTKTEISVGATWIAFSSARFNPGSFPMIENLCFMVCKLSIKSFLFQVSGFCAAVPQPRVVCLWIGGLKVLFLLCFETAALHTRWRLLSCIGWSSGLWPLGHRSETRLASW